MTYKDPNDPRKKENHLRHYRENKEAYAFKRKKQKQRMKDYVHKVKEENPCTDCGEYYKYYIMQFDHLDSGTKIGDMMLLINRGSWANLLAEIEKCELVCANCHAGRTFKRRSLV